MSSQITVSDYEDRLGRTERYDIGVITRRDVRRYARAVEDDNPLFTDLEHAREHGFDDLVVPPNYVSAIIDPSEGTPSDRLREDGLDPTRYPIEMPADAAMIGGGQRLEFDRYLTAGERVTAEETFADLYQREGSTMGTLTFLETDTEYFVGDERVIRCEKTTIAADRQ